MLANAGLIDREERTSHFRDQAALANGILVRVMVFALRSLTLTPSIFIITILLEVYSRLPRSRLLPIVIASLSSQAQALEDALIALFVPGRHYFELASIMDCIRPSGEPVDLIETTGTRNRLISGPEKDHDHQEKKGRKYTPKTFLIRDSFQNYGEDLYILPPLKFWYDAKGWDSMNGGGRGRVGCMKGPSFMSVLCLGCSDCDRLAPTLADMRETGKLFGNDNYQVMCDFKD